MVRLGLLLVTAAVVLLLMDWDGVAKRMPTQVPASRFALYPLIVGALLVVVGLARP